MRRGAEQSSQPRLLAFPSRFKRLIGTLTFSFCSSRSAGASLSSERWCAGCWTGSSTSFWTRPPNGSLVVVGGGFRASSFAFACLDAGRNAPSLLEVLLVEHPRMNLDFSSDVTQHCGCGICLCHSLPRILWRRRGRGRRGGQSLPIVTTSSRPRRPVPLARRLEKNRWQNVNILMDLSTKTKT